MVINNLQIYLLVIIVLVNINNYKLHNNVFSYKINNKIINKILQI